MHREKSGILGIKNNKKVGRILGINKVHAFWPKGTYLIIKLDDQRIRQRRYLLRNANKEYQSLQENS